MEVILYTTHCPQCTILEKKLKQKNIEYTEITDVSIMKEKKMLSVPQLCVDGGNPMMFKDAVDWVNSLEV